MKSFDQDSNISGFKECKKTATAFAKQMDEEFVVHTLEGTMRGKCGDYLMKGAAGELYVCDEDIFEETYEFLTNPRGDDD